MAFLTTKYGQISDSNPLVLLSNTSLQTFSSKYKKRHQELPVEISRKPKVTLFQVLINDNFIFNEFPGVPKDQGVFKGLWEPWLNIRKLNVRKCVTVISTKVVKYSNFYLPNLRIIQFAGSRQLCATMFLPTMFACWHTYVFSGEDKESELLKRDESNRVYWFEKKIILIST